MVRSCLLFIRSGQNILKDTVKVGRRQGRRRKRWEDNIREWIGLEFAKSQREVENIKEWRKLVVKSSEVPQRPSRVRDRWRRRHVSVVTDLIIIGFFFLLCRPELLLWLVDYTDNFALHVVTKQTGVTALSI